MKKYLKVLSTILLLAVCCPFLSSCSSKNIDYSLQDNWAYYQISPEKSADLFLVCPTVDMGRDGNKNMSIADKKTKEAFVGALNMERGLYEDALTLYAPFYRQVTFPVYSMSESEAEPYFELAYQDVRAAFLYYTDHAPKDRPFVLAGFSQGSDMVLRLLKEFFSDSAMQDRLIAAYCIGWRVTQDDLDTCPWLKPAQSANDTGVIVSFTTEAESITESLLVPRDVKTYAINPINWKTDGTPAGKDENMGACFTDYSGTIVQEIPAMTGAYLDEVRGTLKAPDVIAENYSNSLFPDGVYHLYDYQFFFRNLQANVNLRTAAYLDRVKSTAGVAGNIDGSLAAPKFFALEPKDPVDGKIGAAANFMAEKPTDSQIYSKPLRFYDGDYNDTVLLIKNFETYQQTSEYSCGPACMVMLLNHYGMPDIGENALSEEMDARYYDCPREDGSYGTTTAAIAKALTDRGFKVQSSRDTEDADGYSFLDIDAFTRFIKEQLTDGNPILTENVEWGGHWMALIGYDDMGTDSQADDMLIFADPYDVSDQYQDGYITKNCYRYFSEWFDFNILPDNEKIQQYVTVIDK